MCLIYLYRKQNYAAAIFKNTCLNLSFPLALNYHVCEQFSNKCSLDKYSCNVYYAKCIYGKESAKRRGLLYYVFSCTKNI